MSSRSVALVKNWGPRLRDNALVAEVMAAVHERERDVQLCALDGLQRENPAFERAASEKFRNEAIGHCNDIGRAMFGIAASTAHETDADPFGFVRVHAIRRARQQFPLAGSLNAYRLAHKGYWTVMRESVVSLGSDEQEINACSMMLSEFLLEFFDTVSGVLTDAYFAEEKRIAGQHARARVALMEDLLHGRPPGDLEARELCERCGIRPGMHIAVATVRPVKAIPANDAAREEALRSLSEITGHALTAQGLGTLIDCRNDTVIAICAGQADIARAMATALQAVSAKRKGEPGLQATIGIGLAATEISDVPRSHQEAERAADLAEPKRPVVYFADIDLVELLMRRPDAAALRLLPEWASHLRDADGKRSGDLLRTVQTFADCDLNVKRTARSLKLHTNTVYFRLNSIKKLTGVDPRSFSGTSLLLAALHVLDAKGNAGKDSRGA